MPQDDRNTAMSSDVEGRDQTQGAPGTTRGRAGTAQTDTRGADAEARGEARAETHRPTDAEKRREADAGKQREAGAAPGADRSAEDAARAARPQASPDLETDAEGLAGEGRDASGTVPGSFGGTTGTSGHSAGEQSPGATAPPVRGIDPDEARGKVGRRRDRE